MLAAYDMTLRRHADRPAITYFDGSMTYAELDKRASILAASLINGGFVPGDRLAIYTQNNPSFVVGLLAAWKAGGAAALINPMNRHREVATLLADSGATALLALDELHAGVSADVVGSGATSVAQIYVFSARDDQTMDDRRVLADIPPSPDMVGVTRLHDLWSSDATPVLLAPDLDRDTPAVLTYTSGTTGAPKGAVNTHGGLAFSSEVFRHWLSLSEEDVILGMAPLFHITGLVGHVTLSLLLGSNLVLAHRFDRAVMIDAISSNRVTFVIGAITAFDSMARVSGVLPSDFDSVRVAYSGGAPVTPGRLAQIHQTTGLKIHNIYGMTETTSPAIAVPLGTEAPVDPVSGALSIGKPVFGTSVRVLDDDHSPLPPGQIGELAVRGPQVIPGYWRRPDETTARIQDGEIRTGDVGFVDELGWVFLIGRKTDMIIASGYKVWPREVEDVLMSHPDVEEAAVIGVPDDYRGQTVKAFVVPVQGVTVEPDALIAFCKDRMAAYKYPRLVEVRAELPKNAAGKLVKYQLSVPETSTATSSRTQ